MPKQQGVVVCAIAGALIGAGLCAWMPRASAQSCDDRYPSSCRGFGYPQAPQPIAPQIIAPYGAQEPEPITPAMPRALARPADSAIMGSSAGLYAGIGGEPFPIPAVDLSRIGPQFLRRTVAYPTSEPAGTIVIDPASHFLYLV